MKLTFSRGHYNKHADGKRLLLCLNTRLRVNKKYQNSHYFIEINVNVCLLCAHHLMSSIILHTRRPNCQQRSLLRTWFLCFSWLSFFAFWETEMHVFHFTPFRPTSYVLMILKWLEVSNRVRNWNKIKTSFSWSWNLN